MNPFRRRCLARLLHTSLVVTTMSGALQALAQDTRRPIRLLVGYPPGGPADVVARILSERLSAELKRAIVVDNRPGAGGQIAAQALKVAPADGSVLFLSNTHTVVTVPLTMKTPGFAPSTDFRTVGTVASFELALAVHEKSGVKTLSELKAWLASHPKEASIGVPAPASAPEFVAGTIARSFRVDTVPVSYKGAAPMVQDLLGGQVVAAVSGVSDFLPYLDKGLLRILAVTRKTPLLPGVPSFADAGLPGLEATDVLGVYAPAGMSDSLVAQYNAAIQTVLSMPDVAAKLRTYAMTVTPSSPTEHAHRLADASRTIKSLMQESAYVVQ